MTAGRSSCEKFRTQNPNPDMDSQRLLDLAAYSDRALNKTPAVSSLAPALATAAEAVKTGADARTAAERAMIAPRVDVRFAESVRDCSMLGLHSEVFMGYSLLMSVSAVLSLFVAVGCRGRDTPPVDDAGVSACTTDVDCDDGLACTEESCAGGACRRSARVCPLRTRCDEARDACVGSVACASDAACEDGDACTMGDRCDPSTRVCAYDGPLDGDMDGEPPVVCGGGDCDDARASVRPGAIDLCNGLDDDCNGTVDDGAAAVLCPIAGSVCTDGACDCGGGRVACVGETFCIDSSTSRAHCGGCGNPCAGECLAGVCDETCGGIGEGCCGTVDLPYCVEGHCWGDDLCSPCGATGETCCYASDTDEYSCREGGCVGSTLQCGACGGLYEECCQDASPCAGTALYCNPGTNRCALCGGEYQDCCDGSTCEAGFACGGGVCVSNECTRYDELVPITEPRCSAATRGCASLCAVRDQACLDDCTLVDDTPPLGTLLGDIDCTACVFLQEDVCASSIGCSAEADAFFCCRAASLLCDGIRCTSPGCNYQLDAYVACLGTGCGVTSTAVARCFP